MINAKYLWGCNMENKIEIIYDEFLTYLEAEDKEKSVSYILSKLDSKEIDIVSLYSEILAPSINEMFCSLNNKSICVWQEHIRRSIIRTILECCYPYVLNERESRFMDYKGEKVLIICPPDELHEIGPRMTTDFFILSGYEAIFVASSTTENHFIEAIKVVKPRYIALSISNYPNLVIAKSIIDKIRSTDKDIVIIVSGHAFEHNSDIYKKVKADLYMETFEDIINLNNYSLQHNG